MEPVRHRRHPALAAPRLGRGPAGRRDGADDAEASERERCGAPRTVSRRDRGHRGFRFNTPSPGSWSSERAAAGAGGGDGRTRPRYGEAVETLLLLMAPLAPHIAEELWARAGGAYTIHQQSWPMADPPLAAAETMELVVQVNGKVRDRLVVTPDTPAEEIERMASPSSTSSATWPGARRRDHPDPWAPRQRGDASGLNNGAVTAGKGGPCSLPACFRCPASSARARASDAKLPTVLASHARRLECPDPIESWSRPAAARSSWPSPPAGCSSRPPREAPTAGIRRQENSLPPRRRRSERPWRRPHRPRRRRRSWSTSRAAVAVPGVRELPAVRGSRTPSRRRAVCVRCRPRRGGHSINRAGADGRRADPRATYRRAGGGRTGWTVGAPATGAAASGTVADSSTWTRDAGGAEALPGSAPSRSRRSSQPGRSSRSPRSRSGAARRDQSGSAGGHPGRATAG